MYGSIITSSSPSPSPSPSKNNSSLQHPRDEEALIIDDENNNNSCSSSENEPIPITVKEHTSRILELAVSFAVTMYCIFSFTLLAAAFLGKSLGRQALSGFGLGVCFINFAGFSTITGLVMGLDTLLPQAVGMSPTHPQISKLVQRAFGSVLIWVCFVALLFVSAPHWFDKIGMSKGDPLVAEYGGRTVQLAAIGLVPYLLEEILQSYLGALSRAKEIFFGAFCGAAVNPIFLYIFVTLDYVGFNGGVLAWCLSIVTMFVSTLIFAHYRGAFDGTWHGLSCKVAFTNWSPFLRAGVPAMLQLFCEWSCWEVNNFFSSWILPPKQFTSQVLLAQMTTFLFPLVLGLSISVNVLVGNDIGAKRAETAKKTAYVGTILLFFEFAFDALIIFTPLMGKIGRLFTDDDEVLKYFEGTFHLAFVSHVFDSLFCMLGSVIRALGHQKVGMKIAFVGYWVVGLPLGVILAIFVMEDENKIYGLWIGPCVGQAIACALALWYLIYRVEWIQTEELANDLNLENEE